MDQQPRAPSPLSPPSLSPLPSDMDQQPTATGSMLLWKAKSTQSGGIVGRFIRLLLLEELERRPAATAMAMQLLASLASSASCLDMSGGMSPSRSSKPWSQVSTSVRAVSSMVPVVSLSPVAMALSASSRLYAMSSYESTQSLSAGFASAGVFAAAGFTDKQLLILDIQSLVSHWYFSYHLSFNQDHQFCLGIQFFTSDAVTFIFTWFSSDC
uniref:Uncharacterized protein n=1 Tax=Oryza punctata TaxID=4537 RepID=A0A0E0MNJ7_ORYPU